MPFTTAVINQQSKEGVTRLLYRHTKCYTHRPSPLGLTSGQSLTSRYHKNYLNPDTVNLKCRLQSSVRILSLSERRPPPYHEFFFLNIFKNETLTRSLDPREFNIRIVSPLEGCKQEMTTQYRESQYHRTINRPTCNCFTGF